jgi:hypothetical protein
MSVEKIRLPDFLLADLYKNSLVEIDATIANKPAAQAPETKQREVDVAEPKLKYLGENRKNVTILVEQPKTEFLNKEDLTFLTNILKACQLSLPDIAIVNIVSQSATFQQIKEQLNPAYLLLFNVETLAIKLPFVVPAFQLQDYDGCKIMTAPPLSSLNQPTQDGKLLKTKLWMGLKQMFNI